MSRGRVKPPAESAAEITRENAEMAVTPTRAAMETANELYRALALHIDRTFEEHRLAYAFKDEDNADGGKVPTVFVCTCKDGFERQNFNRHLRERLREPFLQILGERETELKALVDG